MTIREFNNIEEIKKYYDEKTNTYIFKEDDDLIDLVVFNFNLNVSANIRARDIKALNIKALDIKSWDINANNIKSYDIDALDIKARDIFAENIHAHKIIANDINALNIIVGHINARNISYRAVCVAYHNIKCKSIKGGRENHKHFVLDGKLEIEENVD